MIQPHFYGFAAYELYGSAAPALSITTDGVFLNGDVETLSPAPQALLDLAANLAARANVPRAVSDRQFFQALAKRGYITKSEMINALKVGDIPLPFQMVIDALAPGQLPAGMDLDDVEALVIGATSFERNHPVSQIIAATFGWSDADADEFWTFAATL